MTYITKPKLRHPGLPKNNLGFTHRDYEGSISTLCAGCGHDSISSSLIQACFELDIEPHRVAKLSGIGCSSKTPDYLLGNSHGFNSVHGRMPSVLTGANLANRDLIYLGISGDGDSASIGLGQFAHCVRRGVNMVYICENNGVYGLTKGQFSATADKGSKSKTAVNNDSPIDLVSLALILGATFVARSFSGDKTQLVPLLKAAISHRGSAVIDVVSPCVQFNNNPASTKSYDFVREHNEAVNRLDFIEPRAQITVDYEPGTVEIVTQHDGSQLRLSKLHGSYDARDRVAAMTYLQQHHAAGEVVTGLLYLDPEPEDLHAHLSTIAAPLNTLGEKELCPGAKALADVNQSYR
ncbi:MAG: 2-oxoacid:ferredoxin oxidoreductase subunit beta [Rhizomicrobium sp.]|jgi:2-oxoglutarate ferredoxin oxidoreductase subunit beta